MAGTLPNSRIESTTRGVRRFSAAAVAFGVVVLPSFALPAQDLDLRLWIAWGGGAARQWQGEIQVVPTGPSGGGGQAIVEFQPVGLSPDAPGSIHVAGNRLIIDPRTPRSYDAVNVHVRVERSATVEIALTPDHQTADARHVKIPLEQLLSNVHTSVLDERGNRLLVRRSPGDDLRVRFDREHLVFAPGDPFDFHLDPHLFPVEPDDSLVYDAELRRQGAEDSVWEDTRTVRADSTGEPPESSVFHVQMPDKEGVYDLRLTVSRRRLPTRFAPTKILQERNLQLVVIRPDAPTDETGAWRTIHEIQAVPDTNSPPDSSTTAKIWNSLPKLPQWKWIPGASAGESTAPVGNGLSSVSPHGGRDFVQLRPGGWQAYPLAVGRAGVPYAIEIEFPGDVSQTLGASILEANVAGRVSPIGPSFGVDVSERQAASRSGVERHRLIFWPQTEKPVLLLLNRREDGEAIFGTIRILGGLERLPAQPIPQQDDGRLLALYFDQPLLSENFSAEERLDAVSGRSLKDWGTFLQAGTRLSQYVKYAGSNGAMVSVFHEGGTIYPSRLLQPTPKYDNGVYFGTGQDPMQKDVLELLFRVFDREGLTLVPALQFATPLPELEDLLRRGPQVATTAAERSLSDSPQLPPTLDAASNILLHGIEGASWREARGVNQAVGPHYNPLSPEVQLAIRRIVVEVVRKYSDHPSFGGVAIQLGPETYMQFPNATWGGDPDTMARFARDEGIALPGLASRNAQLSAAYVSGEGRSRWLNWRARKLAEFYQTVADDVSSQAPEAKLYFAGANMLSDAELQTQLRPRLPESFAPRQAILAVGVDPLYFRNSENAVMLRPYRLAPLNPLDQQAVNHSLRRSTELDVIFSSQDAASDADNFVTFRPRTAGLLYFEPQVTPIASFQQRSPFGADMTPDRLLTHISHHGHDGRQWFIHSLAALDCQEVFSGGWLGAIGQNESMADVVRTFRQLPNKRFATVDSNQAGVAKAPLVVRQLHAGGQTYVYAVNDSPWPVTAKLNIAGATGASLRVLSQRLALPGSGQSFLEGPRTTGTWSIALDPWDMTAAVIENPAANVVSWNANVGRETLAELQTEIDHLRSRANQLRDPRPLPVLTNPDFENPVADGMLPGWEYSRGANVAVELDSSQSRSGVASLRVRSQGPVTWVRSNPFKAPKTGRLSVWIWLKIEDDKSQPPLQLAVEGRLDGQTYYRPARVGASDGHGGPTPPALSKQWSPYLVRIDNLPTSGLTDLRVAVDLMGKGEVWVDDVQVFDLWFDKTERSELLKKVALASFQLGKGEVAQCGRTLSGFWPQFLRQHVPLENVQLAESNASGSSGDGAETAPKDGTADKSNAETSWLQRMVPRAPRMPTWFR